MFNFLLPQGLKEQSLSQGSPSKCSWDGCVCVFVTESYPTLCYLKDCSPPSSSVSGTRQEYWSGNPFPSPGDLPHPEAEPWFPASQADSFLLSEPRDKSYLTTFSSPPDFLFSDAFPQKYCGLTTRFSICEFFFADLKNSLLSPALSKNPCFMISQFDFCSVWVCFLFVFDNHREFRCTMTKPFFPHSTSCTLDSVIVLLPFFLAFIAM